MPPKRRRRLMKTAGPGLPRLARLARLSKLMRIWRKTYRLPNGRSRFMKSTQLTANEALEANEAVQVAFEELERAKASEIEAAVQEAIRRYCHSYEFSTLLDKEVGSEMADLVYRFKRYSPRQKLNLNFIANPPPLPEGITEGMIEDYEGEDASEEPVAEEAAADAEEATADAEEAAADAEEATADAEEAAA
ncbi:unnamed protein product [Prunus armeniaca]